MKPIHDETEPLSPAAPLSAIILESSSLWFEPLFGSRLFILFLHDPAGRILDANPAFLDLAGYSPKDLPWLSLERLFEKAQLHEYWRFVEICREPGTEKPSVCEMVLRTRDGGRAWIECECPAVHENATLRRYLVVARDVTFRKDHERRNIIELREKEEERKRLTAQLQQAQKMEAIGTLAGGIAHDFNNLLMAIQGNVSLLLFDMDSSYPGHRILANIEKLIRSGADLTSKLLGYARKGKYEARPVELNDLVRETSETFGRMRKNIVIIQDLAEDLKSIIADRGQIEQVLLNLFVNASDAMPKGGRLTLKTRNATHLDIPFRGYGIQPGHYAKLTIADTGIGMEREVMGRIFDPFFTTKTIGRGTGLGLASAYGIVKGHNGYIDVESEKGKGSIFYIYLPATQERSAAPSDRGWRPAAGIGTILLVDDEQAVLDATAQMVERLGYTVIRAGSGREALERYREDPHAVSLVILDMIMPEMGGGEVFDQLKAIEPRVKVLLASGFSMQGQAREIMSRGCIGFIQKPFSLEDLALRLARILNPA